ncbi:S66 family peptidase [Niveibacterium umoris]|uniref:Muramoyltetrapeptide carboxypeptidase LdcA involved in peptidoglycan recycling n=1 Tax=Niveibacterium umoris TaxID=1193620 RepID=A0A840BRA8_9RHOO|nr:S66 peptidase family protein [Niveibacterium umoris]MBB4013326.1 muramoyltetrapeptide carboxypeptidase LdcA involved in peptidoglycan recycling [Niveibacterium umoris]
MIRYPAPLRAGARVAVTAPSSGVGADCHPRLDLALAWLRQQGLTPLEGHCLRTQHKQASAPAAQRAAELMHCLLDPAIAAVMPPWGGELAIEVLPRLDWQATEQLTPTWLLGYSDTSTLLMALTLRLRWATAHGPCLMDLVPGQTDPLITGLLPALGSAPGGAFTQRSSAAWQADWGDYTIHPERVFAPQIPTRLALLDVNPGRAVQFSGRLIGGCLDTVRNLAGSPCGDVPRFVREAGDAGAILYFENCNLRPSEFLCVLQGLKLAGWFEGLAGVLVGRSSAGDVRTPEWLNQREALVSGLADLPCPVLLGCDIGHMPPQWLLINGALAEVRYADGAAQIEQRLV